MSPPPLNPLHLYLEMNDPQGCLEMLPVAKVATRSKAFPMELQFNSISSMFLRGESPIKRIVLLRVSVTGKNIKTNARNLVSLHVDIFCDIEQEVYLLWASSAFSVKWSRISGALAEASVPARLDQPTTTPWLGSKAHQN